MYKISTTGNKYLDLITYLKENNIPFDFIEWKDCFIIIKKYVNWKVQTETINLGFKSTELDNIFVFSE